MSFRTPYEQHCDEHGVPEDSLFVVKAPAGHVITDKASQHDAKLIEELSNHIVKLHRDDSDFLPRMVSVFPVAGIYRYIYIAWLQPLKQEVTDQTT